MIQPITELLSKESPGRWTEACTQARNYVCEALAKRLKLSIPRVGEPFQLFLDADEIGVSAVLT